MMLVVLQNNSLIDVLCNRKYCLYVKLIFSVFIFPLIILTIQIKSWQSHQINKILPRKFCGIPAKLLRKKNKTCFEVWRIRDLLPILKTFSFFMSLANLMG